MSMRALHYAMMGITLVAVLTISVGAMQPWVSTAEAQHGDAGEAQHGDAAEAEEHFNAFAAQLELSADQQHAIADSFQQAMAAMETLHEAHNAITAELDDTQKEKFTQMVHDMLGASLAEQQHGHGGAHEASH